LVKLFAVLATSLFALSASHGPGTAQQAPANLRPTRDVVVDIVTTLQAPGRTDQRTGQVAWLVGENLVRVETRGVLGWTLHDQKLGRAVMVMDDRREVVPLPPEIAGLLLRELPAEAPFYRQGTDAVAGRACVSWRVAMPHGDSAVCLTEDGVLLRWAPIDYRPTPAGLSISKMEATAVSYRAQDPTRFRVPAGYATIELPPFGKPDIGRTSKP
jgi:hypothetical protein